MEKYSESKKISLIVGSIYEDFDSLNYLFDSFGSNVNYLSEIICVISGVNTSAKLNKVSKLKNKLKIKTEIIFIQKIVMPGEARNVGIQKSKYPYICFLDSYPLPDSNWLANSIKVINEKNLRGVLGNLKFTGINEFEKCFISATYGNNPLNSVPGTLIEKNLFQEIGFFMPNTRSGEDSEWINRSKHFYPQLIQAEVIPCKYIGLKGLNFIDLCKKWYLYSKMTVNPRFYSQRILYFSFLIIFALLIAFGWNDKVANWDENSFYYVPHIAKIIISLIFLIYFIYRMIILPIRKNVNVFKFNFIEFSKFIFISIILDFIKLIAFINNKN